MRALLTVSGFFFDTNNTITCNVDDATLQEALRLCSVYEKRLSRFITGSGIWRINNANGKPVEVSDDTIKLLSAAEQMRIDSSGAFNIAIGSVVELWDFSGKSSEIPSEDALKKAREHMEKAILTIDGNVVRLPPRTTIDVGGIAKGFICDRIATFLRGEGAKNGVLNFGGNVTTIGKHPSGRPWQVGLQTPIAKRNEKVFAMVESTNNSVVTSGIYERSFVLGGRLYHHIIDPRTCYPVSNQICSATVVMKDGMYADALSTALLIMGEKEGFALMHKYGAKAAILNTNGELRYSKGMPLNILSE